MTNCVGGGKSVTQLFQLEILFHYLHPVYEKHPHGPRFLVTCKNDQSVCTLSSKLPQTTKSLRKLEKTASLFTNVLSHTFLMGFSPRVFFIFASPFTSPQSHFIRRSSIINYLAAYSSESNDVN